MIKFGLALEFIKNFLYFDDIFIFQSYAQGISLQSQGLFLFWNVNFMLGYLSTFLFAGVTFYWNFVYI